MKMLTRNLALFMAVLLMLATTVTLLFLSTEKTEAVAITETTVTENWRCYHGATLCDSASRTYTETHEPFWHWIDPYQHPHSTVYGTRTDTNDSHVSGCSFCKRPKWAP